MRPTTFLTSALTTILGSMGAMFTAVIATKGDSYVGYIWEYLGVALALTILGFLTLLGIALWAAKKDD
jgi:hypothetical protein